MDGQGTSTSGNNNNNTVDEDLVNRPDPKLDYEGCASDLHRTDRNGDGGVDQDEYLNFIQEYGKRICFETSRLTLQQNSIFWNLACRCVVRDDNPTSDCCISDDAKISTAGANLPPTQRTSTEQEYLITVCKLTDATIDSKCPPTVDDRDEAGAVVAGPGSVVATPPVAAAADDGGLGWWWALIAAAILLCCLCLCCGFRRMRKKEDEEEREDEVLATTVDKDEAQPRDVEADPEQAVTMKSSMDSEPRSMAHTEPNSEPDYEMGPEFISSPEEEPVTPATVIPMTATSVASGVVVGPDDDDEEETRKRRGGGPIPDDNDPNRVVYRGAPPFPPPENPAQPRKPLNPIPDKERDGDEWDQPGRDIQYPIEKDDMSDGEVEHYDPDGGVYFPNRPAKDPSDWNRNWNRAKPDEPDEVDARKHRIQTGLGEGEVWNKLDEESTHVQPKNTGNGDAFDWVIQSALGALGDGNGKPAPAPTAPKGTLGNKDDDDDDDDIVDFA